MKIGVLCSRVRVEEKLIFQALRERGGPFVKIDVRNLIFDVTGKHNGSKPRPRVDAPETGSVSKGPSFCVGETMPLDCDVILVRCLSHSRAICAARLLQMQGVRVVNTHDVITTCGDKVLTTLALQDHGIPTPRTAIAFSEQMAVTAIEEIGYPMVLKPPVGSWGRLLAKLNDRQAAEAVIEYKQALDGRQHTPFYVQEYVDKPGRDIRTMVVGDETIYAMYRESDHWITNTARGGAVASLPITPEIDDLSRAAAYAVGGGIVAVDLLETTDGSLLVNEVNHTPEFHGAMQAVNVDIAGKMVEYVTNLS
ncbi:MAG: lysine biosynthesis protein LysX [Chloroflexi bacterium]|nr:lysine biosynthesis protein LysX [Chloroflexota bacterium]